MFERGDPGFFLEGDPDEGDPFFLPLLAAAAKFILPAIAPSVVGWVGEKVGSLLGGAVSTGAEALMPSSTGTMEPLTQLVGEQEIAEEEEDFEEEEPIRISPRGRLLPSRAEFEAERQRAMGRDFER